MAFRHTLFVAGMAVLASITAGSATSAGAATLNDERLRAVLVNDASCLVKYNRAKVDAYVKVEPGTPGADYAAQLLGQNACMATDRLAYDAGQLRGAIFVALYQSRFADGDAGLVDASQEAAAWPVSKDARFAALQGFATCVVRADPADARAMVLAATDSAQENAALASLNPHLGGCFAKGGSVTFNRMALSGLLAEALYRLAPQSPVSGI